MNIYILVILTYLSAISHKEPKFLLPIFPPLFLIIGFCLANLYKKKEKSSKIFSRNCMIKFYIIFTDRKKAEEDINIHFEADDLEDLQLKFIDEPTVFDASDV